MYWVYNKIFGLFYNETLENDAEKINTQKSEITWKESAHRDEGPDGYVFGDITRGVFARCFSSQSEEMEKNGDISYSQLQMILYQAIHIYKKRGYIGTISMSHTVGYFTESCTVDISKCLDHSCKVNISDTKISRIFETLVQRLEKRAKGWDNYIDGIDFDPSLTSSAQIGFRTPIINIGWGLSISLTITKSSLLKWIDKNA